MPKRVFRSETGVPERIREGVADLSARLGVPDRFPDEVVACAKANVANVVLPELDYTHIPFVTIDPPGAKDLDRGPRSSRAWPDLLCPGHEGEPASTGNERKRCQPTCVTHT